ncbi:1-acyl-sn-glycerol-3-phosphate acyltransferase [Nioella nitratireducens]|uniref:1-acyl-sn-glycerol-3-phosphate acyltransferase n=1 Tax=Nioella nitratireducens TaxID=1287720 RepID=UPI0008FD1F79|nr:1-acyl-sn-glycerol-3-phosphate acyltransferase [Nioella nitratireducens]
MTTLIEIPAWLLILVMLFAAVTALDRVLMPSVRWYLRRRLERAVERLNERLSFPIQPFKLARRNDTILRLRYDPEVAQAIVDHATERGMREDVAAQLAEKYAREIVPSFSAFTYFGFAIRAARFLSRSLYRVRVGAQNVAALEAIGTDKTVIFVMNHRSNMDYVLVTWLAADRTALAYAVGEWARVWPLQPLIRMLGGYFIRRRHNNALYRKVLARYVQMATENGVTQAVFPEGGLSRTGALRDPKLGLLSYIIDGYTPGKSREVVFVPVALNYDRVMEDRTLIRAQTEGNRSFRFSLKPIFRYLRQLVWQKITRQAHRHGIAAVSFGAPVSLSDLLAQHDGRTEELGADLMARIDHVMPVLPFPVIAHAMASGLRSQSALLPAIEDRFARALEAGAPVFLPKRDLAYTIEAALKTLAGRKILHLQDDSFTLTEEGEALVAFYARSVTSVLGDLPPEIATSEFVTT